MNEELCEKLVRLTASCREGSQHPEGWLYPSVEAFLLAHGRLWTPPVGPYVGRPGKKNECFNNALNRLVGDDDMTYCEGYARGVIPVLHAWLVDSDGQVIDPTWTGTCGRPSPGVEYYGVAFERTYVMETAIRSGVGGVLFNSSDSEWKYMTHPKEVLDPRFAASVNSIR